jgi:hypothetical protein
MDTVETTSFQDDPALAPGEHKIPALEEIPFRCANLRACTRHAPQSS